jgi:hypothetical protein
MAFVSAFHYFLLFSCIAIFRTMVLHWDSPTMRPREGRPPLWLKDVLSGALQGRQGTIALDPNRYSYLPSSIDSRQLGVPPQIYERSRRDSEPSADEHAAFWGPKVNLSGIAEAVAEAIQKKKPKKRKQQTKKKAKKGTSKARSKKQGKKKKATKKKAKK